jgi:anti-sigma regulatory factor (Ser/Thr protein kinase)
MRNKIPCSAERLGLLTSQMIQAISDVSAFQIAHQYLTANRVRIAEADDSQITSAVIGNSGLYEQNIRLKDGHLVSKCSCTLSEEPMCRHCIAVLLEYQRWAQPRQSRKSTLAKESIPAMPVGSSDNGKKAVLPAFTSDVKLSEVMVFLEWLQPATKALERQEPLPTPPALSPGAVSTWIQAIRNLEDRRRESEEVMTSLEAQLKDRESEVGHLTQQLQASLRESTVVQTATQELEREVASYKEMLAKVSELTAEVVRHAGQMRAVTGDMLQKGSQIDTLVSSFKDLAEALQSAVALPPNE